MSIELVVSAARVPKGARVISGVMYVVYEEDGAEKLVEFPTHSGSPEQIIGRLREICLNGGPKQYHFPTGGKTC